MLIVIKNNRNKEEIGSFVKMLTSQYNIQVHESFGEQSVVLGLVGDTSQVDIDFIAAQEIVDSVKRVQEPYKKANRKFHPDNTVIKLPTGQVIGDGSLALIAGPCSVEGKEQICEIAESVKSSGASF